MQEASCLSCSFDGFSKLAPVVAEIQGMQLQGLANYLRSD